jgi:shikimate kinase
MHCVYGNFSAADQAVNEAADPRPRLVLPAGRSLVFVGLMGAGKSAIGRRVAQRLGVPFVDADAEIERAADATISEIFARDGEAVFRAGERRVIQRLLEGPPGVLSTGGGAFMDAGTRERIAARGISVWLKADLETLLERTARRSNRPLLNRGDPRETMIELLAEREPVYALADITVESRSGPPEQTVQAVLDGLERFLAEAGR